MPNAKWKTLEGRGMVSKAAVAGVKDRETMQAQYETGLARLEAKIAEAKVTIIIAVLGIVGLAVAILKFA